MKLVLVGDLFIPGDACADELHRIAGLYQAQCHVLDWETHDLEELNRRNMHVEKDGPSAESPPAQLSTLMADADVLIVHFCYM